MDIYRDAERIASGEPSEGAFSDLLGKVRGTFSYRVCETGTATCSDAVSVTP